MTWRATLVWFIAATCCGLAFSGMLVEIRDPRQLEQQQAVIFPRAEVKLVTFEFEAVGDDERGKQRAKELHGRFLAKIHDLQGGAIITFVTPPGQRISNFRVAAEEVAKRQQAQMVLWGRILVDRSGTPLINARLTLVEPPPGISADYSSSEVRGVIDAPVTQRRVDFSTLENDVTPLAYFLSGLARYYKAAAREGSQATRWLHSSIADFKEYVTRVPEKSDAVALSQAQLYLARAYVRLAVAEPARTTRWLDEARVHAEHAARLNPYDASVPTAQAVIATRLRTRPQSIRNYLSRAVTLAPTDTNLRLNLAVADGVQGELQNAIRQVNSAQQIQKVQDKQISPDVRALRDQLKPYDDMLR